MTFAEKMFSFQGRMRRQDFWICTLIIWGFSIAVSVLLMIAAWGPFMALVAQADTLETTEDPAVIMGLMAPLLPVFGISMLVQLALIWPQLAICVKRLHDRDQSGWWVMLFVGTYVLAIIPFINLLAMLGVFVWWLVNLGILDGTPGPNKYGPSPKDPAPGEVFA